MTGRVIGEGPVPLCAYICHAETVHEVFGEFIDSFSQSLCPREPYRIISEQFRVIVLDHVRARTGGHHNIPGRIFKDVDGMFGNGACFGTQPGVEVRLSAAGLIGSEFHGHAEAGENIHNGLTRLRVERIDETGDEELYVSHKPIVILFQVTPYVTILENLV